MLALAAIVAPLPPHEEAAHDPPAGAAHETAVAAGESTAEDDTQVAAPHESSGGGGARGGRLALLRTPAIAVAVGLVTLCFFGDGAIEGYAALFLRDVLESGSLLTGVALAAFHAASLTGRLLFARRGRRAARADGRGPAGERGDGRRRPRPRARAGRRRACWWSGFALAPVVPTALSLAGRNAPGRSATAVSLVTTIGYSAFVLGPPVVGLLAELTSLRAALDPGRGLDRDDRRARTKGTVSTGERQLVFGYGSLPAEEAGVPVPPARPPPVTGAWRWTTATSSPATRSTSTRRPASGRRSTSPT